MQCTPETFQTGDGYTAKTILSTALAQCECIGHKVEGIDISNVPGEDTGMGQSILDSCKSGGGTGIGNGQGTSETPSSDTASASASDSGGTLIQNDNNTVPAPFGVGSTASPTAKSAATGSAANANSVSPSSSTTGQSSTGAAYTIQVQHVLALLIAGFSSLVMF